MKHFCILSLLLALVACGSDSEIINSNIEGVTYSYDGSKDELDKVTGRAMVDCQKFGRTPVLKNTSEIDDGYVATFDCVKSK